MKKKALLIIITLVIMTACATTNQNDAAVNSGFKTAFSGIGHLVLSPFQIAAGLLEGVASMPYYLATNLHEVNKGMVEARAKITLDDTYESAYGKRLGQVKENGDTGEVFRRMKHATLYFQKVLREYGVPDPEHYILTSVDTANSEGYTLFAVVYRPFDSIRVIDKFDQKTIRSFNRKDRLYYEPYLEDRNGNRIDEVIDWGGIPIEYSDTQKAQAVLITMAANSVINKKQSFEYWEIEERWITGEFEEIIEERMKDVRKTMKI